MERKIVLLLVRIRLLFMICLTQTIQTPAGPWWLRIIASIPLLLLHALARFFAFLAMYVIPYRKKVVRESLLLAFPEPRAVCIKKLTYAFYQSYADVMVELLKTQRLSTSQINKYVKLTNIELIRAQLSEGRPAVLLAAHQCNWEWLLLAISIQLGYPLDVAYKPLKNSWANDLMYRLRTRFGARLIPVSNMARDVIARRRIPRLLVLAADQEPVDSERRHWTKFLNRDTAFYMGADVIVSKLGYPAFFVAVHRVGRGCYEATFELLCGANESLKQGELVERYARRIEQQIHASPQDWPWSHKRWRLRR